MSRAAIRRPLRARRSGSGAGGLLLGAVALLGGVGLLAKARKDQQLPQTYERLGEDELPQVDDFQRELGALGLNPDGMRPGEAPPQLEEDRGIRLEVFDTISEPSIVNS